MEENIPKSHGMSHEKASRVKKRGHNKEHIFVGLIGGEIEVRTTDDGKYPCMLFVMNKRITFNLLKDKIRNTKDFTPVIRLYGSAIEKFNE